MPTLTIKQVPEEILEQLRLLAQRERRSLNQQVIHMLESSLSVKRPAFSALLRDFYKTHGPNQPGDAEVFENTRQPSQGREVDL